MTIRHATPQDAEFVAELARAFDRLGPYVDVFTEMLQRERVSVFIHMHDSMQRTGFIAVEWRHDEGHIHGLVVAEEFRGRGIATQLLDHVEQVARLQEVSALECLTSETDNVPAFSCFIQWGFDRAGPAGRYPHGQPAVRLRRFLEA